MTFEDFEGTRDRENEVDDRLDALETLDFWPGALGLQAVAFALLPAFGEVGRVRFCTDCRKVGEGAGLGTGTPVYDDSTGWFRTGDDTAAAV